MARTRGGGGNETSRYFEDGRVRTGQDYAQIMGEVLRSKAYRCMPDYAARVLFALACQYRKTNNGNLSLISSVAKDFGIGAEWKLRAGLQLLERVGLVEVMRRGHILGGKGICSLYALGWRQIDPCAAYDLPIVIAQRAPNRWAAWETPADWPRQLQEVQRKHKGERRTWSQTTKNAHPRRGEQAVPDVGSEKPQSRTRRGERVSRFPVPDVGVPFKSSGSSSRRDSASSVPLARQLADARMADLLTVARANPSMDAAALAAKCRVPESDAHRALQQLQAGAA